MRIGICQLELNHPQNTQYKGRTTSNDSLRKTSGSRREYAWYYDEAKRKKNKRKRRTMGYSSDESIDYEKPPHKNKYLQQNILEKLSPIHCEQILAQFRDRIERSDIKYIVFERNKFITSSGNNPLKRFLCFDPEFTQEINDKLHELNEIDPSLAAIFGECWGCEDNAFIRFTTATETEETHFTDDILQLYWNNNDYVLNEETLNGVNKLMYKSLEYFVSSVPASYRCDDNLLRHTLCDCSKLVMLDPDLLKEGYTGDNGHYKWGLWKANNLPIISIRKHLLHLRDIICNKNMFGSYIEIDGKYGTGKSLALMYAVNIARNSEYIVIYCPDAHKWVQNIALTVPSNDRHSVFYQHEYARQLFKQIMSAEQEKLKKIPINTLNNTLIKHEGGVDLEMIYEMLEDPVDIKKFESKIINEWMKMGSGYTQNGFDTLYDLVKYGISSSCKYPASLMYDFINEIKKQNVYKVLIACDNIDYWNNFVYGLTTPRNPKVFAWQLSMIDIFSQFQQINSLQNGMVIMSRTTMGKNRKPQFKTHPSHVIYTPDIYTNDEFDSIMWNYQGIKLCSPTIAPDDYKKIYAASARRPIYVQRLSALF